jgi:hypothetical protein
MRGAKETLFQKNTSYMPGAKSLAEQHYKPLHRYSYCTSQIQLSDDSRHGWRGQDAVLTNNDFANL